MANLILNCSTVSVKPPTKANVLVLPVKLPSGLSEHPVVVAPEGTVDYSSLSDGTLVFEY